MRSRIDNSSSLTGSNYNVTKDLTAYIVVNNVLNRAYETSYSAYNGRGSAAMPARSFMIGAKYKF